MASDSKTQPQTPKSVSPAPAASPAPKPVSPPPKPAEVKPAAPAPKAPVKKQNAILQNASNFLIGGIAGMTATTIIQPLDMIKTRLQLKSEARTQGGMLKVMGELFTKEGGVKSFYRGLGSALMRQVVYTTMRLGIFYTALDISKDKYHHVMNPGEKIIASLAAGAISAFVATPFDLALIRFQADGTLPVDQRRNYKNVFNALSRITADEKLLGLWKGALPTIVRAMGINVGMLAPYEECKQRLKPYWGDGYRTYIASSFVAGFLAAFFALPFDNVKTKIQKMKAGPDGKMPYSGFFNCFAKSVRQEKLPKLWVGFPIFYVRIGGHAMLTLLVSDSLKIIFLGKKQ